MKLLKATGLTALVLAVALTLAIHPAVHADDGYRARAGHYGYTHYIDDDDGYRAQKYHRDRYERDRHNRERYDRRGPEGHLRPPAMRRGPDRVPPGHMSPPGLRKGHYKHQKHWKHRGDRYDRYDRDHRSPRYPDQRRDRHHRGDDWDVTIHKDRHGTDVDIRYRKWDR